MDKNRIIATRWERALFTALLLVPFTLYAQPLEVNNAPPITPDNLITNIFLGEGVDVLDVQYEGSAAAVGFFQNGEDEIGLDRGIVMSTGFAASAPGRVGVDAPGGAQSSEGVSGMASDPDMEALAGTADLHDQVAYTITFIPISDTLSFRYVFASEEYPEYVCSEFNDVFGFFISGPGINGPFSNNAENIALIPETNLPVAINNVNPGVVGSSGDAQNCIPPEGSLDFSQYYISNNGSPNRPVFDGFTQVFTSEAVVFPCSTYTIKLVICDVSDELFDSGVFLEAKSFGTGSLKVESATVSLDGSVGEGCAHGQLDFSLPQPAESDYPLDYRILGTAENGVDYERIPPGLFIPAGDSLLSIPIIAFADGLDEGTEFIIIDIQLDPCNRDTVVIPIQENILLQPELQPDTSICPGDTVALDGRVDVPLPPPPTFYSEDTLVVTPHNATLYSDIEVVGVLPGTLQPGAIRSVCIDDLQAGWVDDLRIFLVAPGGQFMELVTDIGHPGEDFIGTCFTPQATTPITSLGAMAQPFTGAFAPEGVWQDLYGPDSPTNGTWRLALFDKFSADVPVLNRWSITFAPSYDVGYQWQPAAGLSCADCPDPAASPDTSTAYILTATDSYGCTSYDTISIDALGVDAPQPSCAASTGSSITLAWPEVPGALSYEVNIDSTGLIPANGANEHTVDGLPLGTTVQIQVQANGLCDSIITTLECATLDCEPPVIQLASITDASCFGVSDGQASLTASGGVAPYAFTLNGQTNATGVFTGLPAGDYQAQAIDSSGCPAFLTVTVGQPDPPVATILADSVSCNGRADGRATLDITAGSFPFDFSWSNGQADSVATGLAGGSYQLALTDADGCVFMYEVEVGEPDVLSLEVAADSVRCAGGTNGRARVTVNGGSSPFNFDFGPGTIIGTSPDQVVGLAAGNYEVTVTDSRGCEAVADYVISEPPPLAAQFSIMDALCADSTNAMVTAVVSGGSGEYTFIWRNSAMDTIGTDAALSGIPAGQYFLVALDENSCTLSGDVIVGEPEPLAYSADIQPATCPDAADGEISLQVSGGTPGYFYSWSDIGDGPAVRDGLAPGSYVVSITGLNGCLLAAELEVGSPPPLELNITTEPPSCTGGADGQATVTVSGGTGSYTYAWVGGQNAPTATGLEAGMASVVVTDGNGCQASATAMVESLLPLELETEGIGPSCFNGTDGSATVMAQGGAGNYSYQWSNGQTGPDISGLAAGSYSVTVTDGNGCEATTSLMLEEPPALESTITAEDATCNPAPDGSATASVQGGTPPYSYAWSDGQSQANAQNLAMGVYTLAVTDANGCLLADTVEIGGVPVVTLSLEVRDVGCNGGADGAVAVTATGGSGPYSYNWSGGVAAGGLASGLSAGSYSVTVTDTLGCTAAASALVGEPAALVLEVNTGRVSCSGGQDGSLSLSISGGSPPYRILWNTGDTTFTLNGLGVGPYSVSVTDADGCEETTTAEIVESSPISLDIDVGDANCYGEASGSINVVASGGLPPYSFRWADGTTGPRREGLLSGSYALSATDAGGCQVVEEIVVGQPLSPLDATVDVTDVRCFGQKNGQARINATGGTPFYRYSLDGDFFSGNNTFIGLEPAPYVVHIRDVKGCTFRTETVVVGEPEPIRVGLGETTAVPYGGTIRLAPEITGGVGAFGYDWEPADSSLLSCFGCSAPLVTVTDQASIKVIVTDEMGCTGEAIVTVYPEKDRPVLVPTGFTPNNDGNNDRLLPHARGGLDIEVLFFRVFDRWGELLFEAGGFEPNDEAAGWDGTFRGQPVPGGVYIWHMSVEFVDGNQEAFRGHTTLIR